MQKPVPEELLPFSEQSLLNLALNGCRVTDSMGRDVTESLKLQTPRINGDYERALKKYRNRTLKQARPAARPPVPTDAPKVKVTAKPAPPKSKSA